MNNGHNTKLTILVVDDDEDLLFLMQQTLIREGYNPIFSPNATNVMSIIVQRMPDLVLLDINMNGLNGEDICYEIKHNSATSAIPVIMFSANENLQAITAHCGADAYLSKPFKPHNLQKVLNQVLGA